MQDIIVDTIRFHGYAAHLTRRLPKGVKPGGVHEAVHPTQKNVDADGLPVRFLVDHYLAAPPQWRAKYPDEPFLTITFTGTARVQGPAGRLHEALEKWDDPRNTPILDALSRTILHELGPKSHLLTQQLNRFYADPPMATTVAKPPCDDVMVQ